MDNPDQIANDAPPLLYQPRFDSRSGLLVGAKLYVVTPRRQDNVVIRSADPAGLASLAACRT